MSSNAKKSAGGRPPKFNEPSRPVTVTLPERTLRDLESISTDRAQAIVKATDHTVGRQGEVSRTLEVVEMVPGQGLIVVPPSNALRRIPWLRMVEISPSRFLLALPSGMAVETLEVTISDQIEALAAKDERERAILDGLRRMISRMRRAAKVSKAELLFVATP